MVDQRLPSKFGALYLAVHTISNIRSTGVQDPLAQRVLTMEMWYDHTGSDERGIHRKRVRPPKGEGAYYF